MKNIIFYNLAGYPNREKFKEICLYLDEIGCQFLEIGIPSVNPSKDGERIARYHKQFREEIDEEELIEMLTWIKDNTNLRIVLMTYYDGFIHYRLDQLPTSLYSSILCVDNELLEYHKIPKVQFYHADMEEEELNEKVKDNKDFSYVNSGLVQTGGELGSPEKYVGLIERLKKKTELPLFIGFGVKSRKDVDSIMGNGGDGAIIGSEFMKKIEEDTKELSVLKEYLGSFKK